MPKQIEAYPSSHLRLLRVSISAESHAWAQTDANSAGKEHTSGPLVGGPVTPNPLATSMCINVPRTSGPYNDEKIVATGSVTSSESSESSNSLPEGEKEDSILYTTRIVFQGVGKHMMLKRMFGFVGRYVIVESPLI